MIEMETLPELIRERQAYLRSLAGHPHVGVVRVPFRQRVGRALVLVGRWVEGRREERVGPRPAFGGTPARLAGRAR